MMAAIGVREEGWGGTGVDDGGEKIFKLLRTVMYGGRYGQRDVFMCMGMVKA